MRYEDGLPSGLLGRIYDTACDAATWPNALAAVADMIDAKGAILFGQDVDQEIVHFEHNARLDDDCSEAYRAGHIRNPWNEVMRNQPVGAIVASHHVVASRELRRTAFYDAVLHPQRVLYNAMVPLARRRGFEGALNICRTAEQGPFDSADLARLHQVLPHLRRAFETGQRLQAAEAELQVKHDILDRLATAILVLDAHALILYANEAAEQALAEDGPLDAYDGVLTLRAPQDARHFAALMRRALDGEPWVTSYLRGMNNGWTVSLAPIDRRDSCLPALGRRGEAAVTLFLNCETGPSPLILSTLRQMHGLTAAEARVAIQACGTGSLASIAAQLGVSPNTVKTHLARIFGKLEVRRRSDLVRLVGAFDRVRGR